MPTILLFGVGICAYSFWTRIPKAENLNQADALPLAQEGCDQSATTTDCEKMKKEIQPDSGTGPKTMTNSFSFGPLKNIYEDKKYGFSLKYPDELLLTMIRGCPGLIDDHTNTKWGFWIGLFNQECIIKYPSFPNFINQRAGSLEDYRKEYIVTDNESGHEVSYRVQPLNTKEIVTSSGAKGIKQQYAVTPIDAKTGKELIPEDGFDQPAAFTRYIFGDPKKNLYVISIENHFVAQTLFERIEHSVIQSISFE